MFHAEHHEILNGGHFMEDFCFFFIIFQTDLNKYTMKLIVLKKNCPFIYVKLLCDEMSFPEQNDLYVQECNDTVYICFALQIQSYIIIHVAIN